LFAKILSLDTPLLMPFLGTAFAWLSMLVSPTDTSTELRRMQKCFRFMQVNIHHVRGQTMANGQLNGADGAITWGAPTAEANGFITMAQARDLPLAVPTRMLEFGSLLVLALVYQRIASALRVESHYKYFPKHGRSMKIIDCAGQ
jgi:hypothetical protein